MLCHACLPVVHLLCHEGQHDTILGFDFVFETKTQKATICNTIDATPGLVQGQLQFQHLFIKLCSLCQVPGGQESDDGIKRHLIFTMCESGSDSESARKSRHSKVFPMSPLVKVASHLNRVGQVVGIIVRRLRVLRLKPSSRSCQCQKFSRNPR